MFSPAKYQSLYERFLGPLARPIQILVFDGSQYAGYWITGHVTRYQESDLVPGGSIQMGDLRLIVLWEDLQAVGISKLGLADRINVDTQTYSVVHFDQYSRSVGDTTIAVEMTIRGGGLAVIASVSVFRVIGAGDQRVTGDGDKRVVKEAV